MARPDETDSVGLPARGEEGGRFRPPPRSEGAQADLSEAPEEREGLKGAAVLEIVEDDDGNTYRTAYAAKFAGVVYVLHAFQKKSTKGVATPRKDIDRIKDRLAEAKRHYAEHHAEKDTG